MTIDQRERRVVTLRRARVRRFSLELPLPIAERLDQIAEATYRTRRQVIVDAILRAQKDAPP